MTTLTQTWSERVPSLKRRAEVMQVYIASVITYHLPIAPNSDLWLNKVRMPSLPLFVEGKTTCEMLHLLSKTTTGRVRDAVTDDAQTCAVTQALRVLHGR